MLDPRRTTASTPRDITTLLSAIWTDQAGPPEACAEVRAAERRPAVDALIRTAGRLAVTHLRAA